MTEKRLEGSSRIDRGDWQAFLGTFSNENRGRSIPRVTELWAARTTEGEIVALEFIDATGRRTILAL